MPESISQPNRRVFSRNPGNVSQPPSQETSASGSSVQEELSEAFEGIGQLAQQGAQQAQREQREIDIQDKHRFMANKAKYEPQIMQKIEENNLKGAPAPEVQEFVKDTEEYQAMFSGLTDERNVEKYKQSTDAELQGMFTEWQTKHEDTQRKRQAIDAFTVGLESTDPEEHGKVVNEFMTEFTAEDGPYKMRGPEAKTLMLDMAEQYSAQGDYDKAQNILNTVDFSSGKDGLGPEAQTRAAEVKAAARKAQLQEWDREVHTTAYDMAKDPSTTDEEARALVDEYQRRGVFDSAQQAESLYNFIVDGRNKSSNKQKVMQIMANREHPTREGFDTMFNEVTQRMGITGSEQEQLRSQVIDRITAYDEQEYQELKQLREENPGDPIIKEEFEDIKAKRTKRLRMVDPAAKTNMVNLANYRPQKRGDLTPEERQMIGQLGTSLEETVEAFGGGHRGMTAMLKTYFGEESSPRKKKIMETYLMSQMWGGSWEKAVVQRSEMEGDGDVKHSSWTDKETRQKLNDELLNKHGEDKARAAQRYLDALQGVDMEDAYDAVDKMLEQDYTYIINDDATGGAVSSLTGGLVDSEGFGNRIALSGKQGKTFHQNLLSAISEEFPDKAPEFYQQQAKAQGKGKAPLVPEDDRTFWNRHTPFKVIENFVKDKKPEWERQFKNLSFGDFGTEANKSIGEDITLRVNPVNPNQLEIIHNGSGTVLENGVTISDLIRRRRINDEIKDDFAPDNDTVKNIGDSGAF